METTAIDQPRILIPRCLAFGLPTSLMLWALIVQGVRALV
jgi:hypothetical protein